MNILTSMSRLRNSGFFLPLSLSCILFLSHTLMGRAAEVGERFVPDLGDSSADISGVESQAELEARELSDSDQVSSELRKHFLYDAETIGFDRTGRRYLFRGDVVLIGRGAAITADQISADYQESLLVAKGHVIFLLDKQIFTGTKITLNWSTGDFVIERAQLVVNDEEKSRHVIRSLLGMTDEEFAFEAARALRMKELEKEKNFLKKEFQEEKSQLNDPSENLLDRYSLLLEQELLLKKVTVPSLSRKKEKDRKTFLKRRRFWQQSRDSQFASTIDSSYYFQLSGRIVERKDQNNYTAIDAKWSPCRCIDEGEEPVWGFQADRIFAQQEGYIEFEHPVLFIKGVPVLYIPYLKLPMKSRRQSGFLVPAIQTGSQINGFVYTQPVYLALSDHHDATLTTDFYQKRGTRFGLELRYKERDYSGFELQLETIRDEIWLRSSLERSALRDYYLGENGNFCDGQDDLCADRVSDRLATPSNTWRGKNDWQGRYFLTPRVSLVSKGSILSDHRYLEDLYLPDDYAAAFSTRPQARAFSPAKAKLSYDGRDFHLGLSSLYGDSVLSRRQYSGQQMPLSARFVSRTFPLYISENPWLPTIYASLIGESIYIRNEPALANSSLALKEGLGSGQWQRSELSLISPLKKEGPIRLDYFWDSDLRYITHSDLGDKNSSILSWRHGLSLNMPIDGFGTLPNFMQDSQVDSSQILHHIMNWSVTFSSRPVVVREGLYGEVKDSNGASLVYFASDRDFLSRQDTRDVSNEDTMVTHQRITLATSHRWRLFRRSWEPVYGLPPLVEEESDAASKQASKQDVRQRIQTLHEKAYQELNASRDRRLTSLSDILTEQEAGLRWHTNRYTLTESDHSEPFFLNASVTYDFALEKLRQDQISENRILEQTAAAASAEGEKEAILAQRVDWLNLPEPWLGPYINFGINWLGYQLSSQIDYNIYKKIATSSIFDLRLPSIYSTVVSFRYVDEKAPYLDLESDELLFRQTQTRSVSIRSQLLSSLSAGLTLLRRDPEEQNQEYASSLNVSYTDDSGCWGMRFVREKDLNQDEKDANYVLQLSIIFVGNRQAADISPALKREIPHLTLRN